MKKFLTRSKISIKRFVSFFLIATLCIQIGGFNFIQVGATSTLVTYNFDSESVGSVDPAFSLTQTANDNLFAKVTNSHSYSTQNSLWIRDNSSSAIATTVTQISETQQMTLSMEIYPESFATEGCYAISLSASGSNTIANHIYLFYDGSIKCHNGSSVVNVLPAGTIKTGQWNKIKIAADIAGECKIYVNNSSAGTVSKWDTASSYKEMRVSSYGGQELGDSFYIDDVVISNTFDNTPNYPVTYNFDSESVGSVDPAFSLMQTADDNLFAKVTNSHSYSTQNSLWIRDNSSTAIATTVTQISETQQMTLSMEIYPESFATEGCYAISLSASGSNTIANHIYLFYDGSIKCHNGSSVVNVLPAGTLKTGQWNKIKIAADITGECKIYVNNSSAGTVSKWDTASSYKEIRVSSYGGQELGDSFYIDDVVISNTFDNTPNYPVTYNFDSESVDSVDPAFSLTQTANDNLFAKVTNSHSFRGQNSLWIRDNSNEAIARTVTQISETQQMTLSMEIYPESFATEGCYAISLSANGSSTVVNHIYLFYDGSIKCYNGSSVINVLPAGTLKTGQWNKIKIAADVTGECKIYVNNSSAGTVSKWNTASSYKAICLSSYGGQELGDSFYIDDVVISNTFDNTPNMFLLSEERFQIDVSNDGKERQFPFVYKFGNTIFASYSEHEDAAIASPIDGMMISRDNGVTWTKKVRNPDFYITSMYEKDGTIYAITYFTYPLADKTTETMVYWTTTDMGETWTQHNGLVKAPVGKTFKSLGVWSSMLFHRDMLVMNDGSIQGLMYGIYEGDTYYSSVWVKSTDNCATWQIVSTVAGGMPEGRFLRGEGYCEPTVVKTRDGSLLCILRLDSFEPLYQCRSFDNGLTWTKPIPLPGLTREQACSVDPKLILMQNGVLALSFGRPNDRIAFSSDGNGYKWDYYKELYTGQTEGYTSIVETEPGRLLYVADQGRTGAVEKAIWGQFLNVNIAPTNYDDTKVKGVGQKLNGITITGSTGLTSTTGPNAAIDGDNTTPYIPANTATPFSLVLDLGQTKIASSVLIRYQFTSTYKYKLETSIDGNTWTTYADKTDNDQLIQDTLDVGNSLARYVKLTIIGYGSVGAESYISINEIEIFSPIIINNYKVLNDGTNRITNIQPDSTVESFNNQVGIGANISLTFIDAYGHLLVTNDIVGTGTTLTVVANGITTNYTIIVYGDVDGINGINISDLVAIKKHLLKISTLTGDFLTAGDVYNKNTISVSDLLAVKKSILGIATINQNNGE